MASCDTVNGSYEWHGYFRPVGDDGLVRDSALYKDQNGDAYFIYDRVVHDPSGGCDRCLTIVKLAPDYCSCTDAYQRVDALYWREAPSVCFHEGYYYMFTSGLTSWTPNPAKYFRAPSMMGPWEDMGDPCVDDLTENTFNSQSTYVFPIQGRPGKFIHMAERHNTENFLHCSYIWLPVEFPDGGRAQLTYRKEWSLEDWLRSEVRTDNIAD